MQTILSCPVCGSSDLRTALQAEDYTVSHELFAIQACGTCAFHFTSPRPDQEHIGAYYLSEDYISHSDEKKGIKESLYRIVRKRAIRSKHALVSSFHRSGSALDVGCGTVDFLAYMSAHGFAAQGVEVSPNARRIAEAKGSIVHSRLTDIPAQIQFQVITLWHVLEHVPDPKETLGQLFERCSQGGVVLIAVPDHECWDRQHYGPKWAAWDVPRHLSHFNRGDMNTLLISAGFVPLRTDRMWYDAPYVSMLSEQYKGAGPMAALVKGIAVGLWSNLQTLFSDRPTSSTLYVAKKS